MKSPSSSTLLALALVATLVIVTLGKPLGSKGKCDPKKCKLPNCRCWDDKERPGNRTDPPQMILLSFDYAVNSETIKRYRDIFEGLFNPNGCVSKGTFFVQKLNSELSALEDMLKEHHELAVNSVNGIIPTNAAEWESSMSEVMKFLEKTGLAADKIKGVRAPELFCGGNDQFSSMANLHLQYDASCSIIDYSAADKLLWPFTLDNIEGLPACSTGRNVNGTYPGIWRFPVPVLDYGGQNCATPSGCIPEYNTTDLVFQLFYNSFDAHYYKSRAPFTLDIDSLWVTDTDRVTGTKQFLQLVGAYPDTWIVTMSDALKWIQDPDSIDEGTWGCSEDEIQKMNKYKVKTN